MGELSGGREFGRLRSVHLILGRDFVRNFDVMIDLNNSLIGIRNPDRKNVNKSINIIITDENKVAIFLDRKIKLQPGQAVVAIFRMGNLNSLSDREFLDDLEMLRRRSQPDESNRKMNLAVAPRGML